MIEVTDLRTGRVDFYEEHIPPKQAIKTSYAFDSGLRSRFATQFGQLMDELEGVVEESDQFYVIGDFATKKNF